MIEEINKMLLDLRRGDFQQYLNPDEKLTEFQYDEIEVSSGHLLFFEPFGLLFYEAFEEEFPLGTFPNYVYTLRRQEDGEETIRMAYHEIRFSDKLPVRYEIAYETTQVKMKFFSEQYAGWSTQSGFAGFVDEFDGDDICDLPKEVLDEAIRKLDDAVEETLQTTSAICVKQTYGGIHTTIVSCGYGDQFFGIYTGYDEDGHVCSLMMDFELIKHLEFEYVDFLNGERVVDIAQMHYEKVDEKHLNTDKLNGYNHLAIFLRWMYEHEMLSDDLLAVYPQIGEVIDDHSIDLRRMLHSVPIFRGQLNLAHFSLTGQAFCKEYYNFEADEGVISYPRDIDLYAEEYVKQDDIFEGLDFQTEEYLFVPFDEFYYQGLAKKIDEAWHRFTSKNLN